MVNIIIIWSIQKLFGQYKHYLVNIKINLQRYVFYSCYEHKTEIGRNCRLLPRAVCCDVQLLRIHRLGIVLKIFHTIFCTSKLRQENNQNLADFQQSEDHTLLTSAPCPARTVNAFRSAKQQAVVVAKWLDRLVFSVRYDLKLTYNNFRLLTVKVWIGGFGRFGRLNLVRH